MINIDFIISVGTYEKHATAHLVREEGVNDVEGSAICPLQVVQEQLCMYIIE